MTLSSASTLFDNEHDVAYILCPEARKLYEWALIRFEMKTIKERGKVRERGETCDVLIALPQSWPIPKIRPNTNTNSFGRAVINTNININSLEGLLSISIPISILPIKSISIV